MIINGMHIRPNTYIDHIRDVRNKNIELLIEITKKIVDIFF